jgi:hypothetical protein
MRHGGRVRSECDEPPIKKLWPGRLLDGGQRLPEIPYRCMLGRFGGGEARQTVEAGELAVGTEGRPG